MVWTLEEQTGRVCGKNSAGEGGVRGKEARETEEEVDGHSEGG